LTTRRDIRASTLPNLRARSPERHPRRDPQGSQLGAGHGCAVSRWIRDVTDEALSIEEGALYPALHRLEQRGLVLAEWAVSDTTTRARHYKLTPQGRQRLRQDTSSWDRFAAAISKVLTATRSPRGIPTTFAASIYDGTVGRAEQ
jgi:PadR family transcriptional regulator PadR